ncbi:ThiF family adenylyltransferase [Streptomyces oceani]|uniref:Thiamine biosynthesis protein ThiF n=1 Tax=Streptomyces oceani TaxID=1075402 RepID=A0A1E7KQ15_9ACTN|nr:ThiF family adenylyltransferase [Streptomyces oceani]OEV05951.1 thiamine biosynthesis protein ThiF [Streptomyces oceani]
MHPLIKPALRRGWRDRKTVQYGVAPAHAIVLGPLDDTTAAFLDLMDGTRSMDRLRAAADHLGMPSGATDRLVDRLTKAGLLDDATADREASARMSDRLRADLASLSTVHSEPGAAPRRLAARGAMRVQVRGAGRVGATVATTLSAAGVGQVDVVDGGQVEPWDTTPGGIPPQRVGDRRDLAARAAVNAARSRGEEADRAPDGVRDGLSLVVIAPRDGLDAYAPDPTTAERFVRSGTPHLYGGVIEGTGVLGPLVLPGVTPCAGCLLRTRTDREPSWPLVVGQWRTTGRRRAGVAACDTALAVMVAGAVTSFALSFLDGDGGCAAGYRMRFALPHLLPDTEQFTPHRECPCGASSATVDRPGSAVEPVEATMVR